MCLRGEIVAGLKKHFMQFWNFANIQYDQKRSIQRHSVINKMKIQMQAMKLKQMMYESGVRGAN